VNSPQFRELSDRTSAFDVRRSAFGVSPDSADRASDWHGLGGGSGRGRFRWSALLWQLVFPQTGHRILPTTSGAVLICLALGVGIAAYNSANNILFITLSLLLACLILSGVLSWLNFRRLQWRLQLAPPFRAEQETLVALELRNGKRFLPTYGIWFDLLASAPRANSQASAPRAKKTPERSVREVLAAVEKGRTRRRLFLRGRLDAGGEGRLEWIFKPQRRGIQRIAVEGVGSRFPFGFLRKQIGVRLRREVIVWPAPVAYRRHGALSARPQAAGEHVAKAGSEGDLLALRKYAAGDSHRLIHWKASARVGQLLVRQFASQKQEAFSIWLQTSGDRWPRAEQFELLLAFAGSLAEDLFRAGALMSVTLNDRAPRAVRRVRDLEAFLDELAVLQPREVTEPVVATPETGGEQRGRKHLLTFAPDGPRGVCAFVDGQKAASV
jgi:uncharacterized protein (DUF58 family)